MKRVVPSKYFFLPKLGVLSPDLLSWRKPQMVAGAFPNSSLWTSPFPLHGDFESTIWSATNVSALLRKWHQVVEGYRNFLNHFSRYVRTNVACNVYSLELIPPSLH